MVNHHPILSACFEPGKKAEILADFLKGDHAFIHLDATNEAVTVPANLKANNRLVLKLSYLFQGQTQIEQGGVSADLMFSSKIFRCVVPWDAIWAIGDEHGNITVWPLSVQAQANTSASIPRAPSKTETLAESSEVSDPSSPAEASAVNRRNLLKRVK